MDNSSVSIFRNGWRRLRKSPAALAAFCIILLFILVALFADFIANSRPLYARYGGKNFFPAFSATFGLKDADTLWNPEAGRQELVSFGQIDWRRVPLQKVVWAPIAYSPNTTDPFNRNYISPFASQYYRNANGQMVKLPFYLRHYFGTTHFGTDVAAAVVHGSRISIRVGLIAVGIASVLGILFGGAAGYFGDREAFVYRGRFWLLIVGLFFAFFYAFITRQYALADAFGKGIFPVLWQSALSLIILLATLAFFYWLGGISRWSAFLRKPVSVPADALISRLIEIMDSLPQLLLLIAIASLFREKSILLVFLIIGLTSWTGIARITRAEFLRGKAMDYVHSARALGYSHSRIIFRHILPNVIGPVLVLLTFGIASAINAEASLSFLGIGVPDTLVSWGSLLGSGRQHFEAWWLVVFPGLAIFITVLSFNMLAESFRDLLDPKLKK